MFMIKFIFLYICVFEYILSLPQLVQSFLNESINSSEKYWRYKTLWQPYEETQDYKKILSDFLSTMNELKSLRRTMVTVSRYADPFFMTEYYVDIFSQRRTKTLTTTQFRKRGQVITRFPYRHKLMIPSHSRTDPQQYNIHTKITSIKKYENKEYPEHNLIYQLNKKNPLIPSFRKDFKPAIDSKAPTVNIEVFDFPPTPTGAQTTKTTPIFSTTDNVYDSKSPTVKTELFDFPPTPTRAQTTKTTPIFLTTDNVYDSKSPTVNTEVFDFPPTPTGAQTTKITPIFLTTDNVYEPETPSVIDTQSIPIPIPISTTDNTEETLTIVTTENSSQKPSTNTSKAYCYMCGLNETEIPRAPTCYQVFDNTERTAKSIMNHFKVRCFTKNSSKKSKRGNFVGDLYRAGCFKRFTDIGKVYSERGCRTMKPTKGLSFASNRFARLELLLKDEDEGCVVSPHASLTPFSRAISLFVRYHVCVCKGRYCNHTTRISEPAFAILHLILMAHYILYLCKSN